MKNKKKEIQRGAGIILILFVLGLVTLIASALLLGTLENLVTSWQFYASNVLIIISLIGLFKYKKWGFYIFTIYVAYLLIDNIINIVYNFSSYLVTWLIIYLIVYVYFVWYRSFYKNRQEFD